MPKRLKYGFPIAITLLAISRFVETTNAVSAGILFLSTLIMMISISKEIVKQAIHIRISIVILFALHLIGVGLLMLPNSIANPRFDQFIWLIVLMLVLIAFIAISFLFEKVKRYMQLKKMEK